MTYQMTLTLSDEEYARLSREAASRRQPIESLVHELLARAYALQAPARPTLTSREFLEQLYREGKIANLPTRQPLTADEQAERERLARRLADGMSASDMVIEDRGPR
jgi:hypothetical protein